MRDRASTEIARLIKKGFFECGRVYRMPEDHELLTSKGNINLLYVRIVGIELLKLKPRY
jgi:hypothetical protein